MVLFVLLRQHTDGWAISGQGSMVETLLLTQVRGIASPEFQMRSNIPRETWLPMKNCGMANNLQHNIRNVHSICNSTANGFTSTSSS